MTLVHERVLEKRLENYAAALYGDRAARAEVTTLARSTRSREAWASVAAMQMDALGEPDAALNRAVAAYRKRLTAGNDAFYKVRFSKADIEVPPVHVPSGREYERELRRQVLNPLHRQIRERLSEAAGAAQAYYEMLQMPGIDTHDLDGRVIRKYFRRLSGQHRKKIIAAFRKALGVDVGVLLDDGFIRRELERRVVENVQLINTIPRRLQADLQASFLDMLDEAPYDRQLIQRTLADKFKSSGYNLRRIVRDQTSKAIGNFSEIRQGQLGIKQYRWSTSGDERVRPTHVRNDGKTFAWADPPVETGHPGHDILCRCVAVAIVPEGEAGLMQRTLDG